MSTTAHTMTDTTGTHGTTKGTTMDTTTQASADARTATRPPLEEVRPISFGRLVRLELRKLLDTRAGKGMIIAIVAVTALAMGIVMWVMREEGASMEGLIQAATTPQFVLLPILGVMTAANEWSQRTALITFTQEPRRLRVMAAKITAAVLLGVLALPVTYALAALGHLASAGLAGGEIDVALPWALVIGFLAAQLQAVIMGVGLGALLLNVPLAIVAYFLIPALTPMLMLVNSWMAENSAWYDLGAAGLPLLSGEWPTTTQWAQFGAVTVLWALIPLLVGLWRIRRREVK